MEMTSIEEMIRLTVRCMVLGYASGFSTFHISEKDNEDGVRNMKIHNVFVDALDPKIQYYSALTRSFDKFLGNMLENLAMAIASLNYTVNHSVEGVLYKEQTDFIAELLERYKRHDLLPSKSDYEGISNYTNHGITKRYESDYYLIDEETGMRYLIELKIGGDLDNKKSMSEKEALLEQYCILTNQLGTEENVRILFATAYNRYGEGKPWKQRSALQFFAEDELCISRDFWNLVCKSDHGYDIVIDEYRKNAYAINELYEQEQE